MDAEILLDFNISYRSLRDLPDSDIWGPSRCQPGTSNEAKYAENSPVPPRGEGSRPGRRRSSVEGFHFFHRLQAEIDEPLRAGGREWWAWACEQQERVAVAVVSAGRHITVQHGLAGPGRAWQLVAGGAHKKE
jgi:hypothetical protein